MEAPKTREYFLDYSKSVILLLMISIHILEQWPTAAVQSDAASYAIYSVGYMFSANAFMLSMGWTFNYARGLTPHSLARRGLRLFGMGYALNFCRSLTALFCGKINIILFCWINPDILHFAGLTMLAFAAAMSARVKTWVFPVAALALTAVGYYVGPYLPFAGDVGSPSLSTDAAKYILGLFYFTGNEYSFFPLLNWLIFPAVGFWVSAMYLRAKQRGRDTAFMQRACVIGYAIVAAMTAVDHFWDNTIVGLVSFDTFLPLGHNLCSYLIYDVPPTDAVYVSAITVANFAALKLIIDAVKRRRPGETLFDRYATLFSRNINTIYIIHWLIIGNLAYPLLLLNVHINTPGYWLCWLAVASSTYALTYLWDKHKRKQRI